MEMALSQYARIFDDSNIYWRSDQEANLMFIKCQEQYLNDLLVRKKVIFLNEVYEMFGFPRTIIGQTVGWYYNDKNPIGDNSIIIDVAVFEGHILLDFNVDGEVIQYLYEKDA